MSIEITRSDCGARVAYVGFAWEHHDEKSGYHHVVPEGCRYLNAAKFFGFKARPGSFKRRVNFLLTDFATIALGLKYKNLLYFYPEQTACFSPLVLGLLNRKLTFVVHLGEDFWFQKSEDIWKKIRRRSLRYVDRIIVLTNQQKSVFIANTGAQVYRIPHGAWIPESTRLTAQKRFPRIIVVGSNYRDFRLLNEIIRCFLRRLPGVTFDLVGMAYSKLEGAQLLPNVVCHKRLSEIEYRDLISKSLLMLLPLTFATANNALLEALSEGTPVYCNRVQGVEEYLPSDKYIFDTLDELVAVVRSRLDLGCESEANEAANLRKFSKDEFDWSVIRSRVLAIAR